MEEILGKVRYFTLEWALGKVAYESLQGRFGNTRT